MLADVEIGIIDAIKAHAIKAHLNAVESLPDLDGDSLVKQFAAIAPGVYVAPAENFRIEGREMKPGWAVACIARNAGGQEKTRRGDGKVIGLFDMIEVLSGMLDGLSAGGLTLYASNVAILNDAQIYKAGLQVAVISLEGTWLLDGAIDEAALADFKTFSSQYDIEPHEDAAEHVKWSEEPPNHTGSEPELTDELSIQS